MLDRQTWVETGSQEEIILAPMEHTSPQVCPMLTSRVTSESFYKGLHLRIQMNYQHSLIKHEPYGEAIQSLHDTVYWI